MNNLTSPFLFSQSSLQDFTDCPRRFELRYLTRLDWPAEEAEPAVENEQRQQDGLLFHRLAQQYLLGMPAEKISRMAASPDLSRWWGNFQADFDNLKDPGNLHPEITLSAPLGNHRLIAKYDLIVCKNNRAIIYDWKTYHKRPRNEWMAIRMQTRVYQYLLVTAGTHLNGGKPIEPRNLEMVYWYTDFPKEPAIFRYDEAHHLLDKSGLEGLIREIENLGKFELTEDRRKCNYCPYRSYCRRGALAGDWRDAELEAEAEEMFDINFEQIAEIAF